MTTTVAPAKKVRKPRVKKLPTVIDNEPVVYGCDLPEGGEVKLIVDAGSSPYVDHTPIAPVVCSMSREDLQGAQLWVDRNGVAYNAYPANKYDWHSQEHKDYAICNGHAMWALYFKRCTVDELENLGWVHISGSRVACFVSQLTRRQKDTLEMWALFNGRNLSSKYDDLARWRTFKGEVE